MGLIPRTGTEPLERDIEARSVSWAKAEGWEVYKFTSPARRSVPDRIFIKRGRVVFVEYKKKNGRLTPGQEREHERLKAAGAEIHVARSLEDTRRILEPGGPEAVPEDRDSARPDQPGIQLVVGHGVGETATEVGAGFNPEWI